jgi:RNA polymerase-binding transcription factor DksA
MRIENKTYGICRVTGKLIDKARLKSSTSCYTKLGSETDWSVTLQNKIKDKR